MTGTSKRGGSLVALALLAACGGGGAAAGENVSGGSATAGGEAQHGTAQQLTNMPEDAGAQAAEPAAPTPPAEPVTVTAGTSTPLAANEAHPRVQIVAPRNNSTVRTDSVEVRLRVTGWPAPQDARHVHLILDNDPYTRIDDPSRPHTFEHLAEGTHVLRAFPGRASHESVKTDGAFAVVVFNVGHATPNFGFDPHAPLLTYSRPKGDYNGAEADHILLDFFISNIPHNELSATGYRVRYNIDGSTTGEATSWVPHYIDHLRDGQHTVTLDLLGPDGQPVAGMFNHTERTINVNHSAPTPPPHEHAAEPAAGGGASAAPAAQPTPPAAHPAH